MAKEKKNRFWYSERQASLDDDVWNINRMFTFVKTPEGYKLYSEWCSMKGTRCNWEDAELVYETDDEPEVIVHNGVPRLVENLQKQLVEKDKEIEGLKTTNDRLYKKNQKLTNKIVEDNLNYYKKGAIAELEKVKKLLKHKGFVLKVKPPITMPTTPMNEYLKEFMILEDDFDRIFDQQIKSLKGEK